MKKLQLLIQSVVYIIFFILLAIGIRIQNLNESQRSKHVILIGIDGMSTEGLQFAHTPNMNSLINGGSISLHARAVLPTISAPNWTSILTGAGPEQHGVTFKKWTQQKTFIEPTIKDEDGYFPSIFNIIRDQMPGAKTAVFYEKIKLENLINLSKINKVELNENYEASFAKAIPYILEQNPVFTFIYIGEVDHVGHVSRFGAQEYLSEIENVDHQIGILMDEIDRMSKKKDFYIIITSDHGGAGFNHDGESMLEIEVPWIINGPGVIHNRLINQSLNSMDTAPTIAYLFHLDPPHEWTGRPVLSVFEEFSDEMSQRYIAAPRIHPSPSQIFVNKEVTCHLSSDTKGVEIHFTLDNNEPTLNSPLYTEPIVISQSIHVQAKAFDKNNNSSSTTKALYNLVNSKNGFGTGKIYKK